MKNRWRKLAGFLLTAVLAVSLPGVSVKADGTAYKETGKPYTYTVTVYAGDKGTFNAGAVTALVKDTNVVSAEATVKEDGEGKIIISGLSYGDRVSVNTINGVSVKNEYKDMYSVRGVRQAGRDSSTATGSDVVAASFPVKKDADYVIAYSLLTDPVTYRVHYVNQDGTKLLDDQIGKANVGETFIVTAEAISGYVPDAYNKSLTLVAADEGTNEITFYYSAIGSTTVTNTVTETDTVTETVTETQYVPGSTTTTEGEGAGAAGAGNAGAATAGNAGAAGNAGNAGAAGNAGDEEPVAVIENEEIPLDSGVEEPEELKDLDDEDVPLDAPSVVQQSTSHPLLIVYIVLALLACLGLLGAFLFLAKRKKAEEED